MIARSLRNNRWVQFCLAFFFIALTVTTCTTSNTHTGQIALGQSGLRLEYSFYRGLSTLQQHIGIRNENGQQIDYSSPESVWKTNAAGAIVFRNLEQNVYYVAILEGLYEIQLSPPKLTNICILPDDLKVEYVGEFDVQSSRDKPSFLSWRRPLVIKFGRSSSDPVAILHDGNNRCG